MIWEMSDQKLMMAFAFVCTAAFICGWIADRIMTAAGFGVVGNWLLLLAGACVGYYTYNSYGYTLTYNTIYTVGVGMAAGASMLLVLAGIKAATHT